MTHALRITAGETFPEHSENSALERAMESRQSEDVKVQIVEGYLTISGERKHETEETKENVYRCGREYGSFSRAIPLPEGANIDNVRATFDNGVLEVTVPPSVRAEVKPRSVAIEEPIKAGAEAVKAA